MAEFDVIQIDHVITNEAIALCKLTLTVPPKIKLPDAIITATAKVHDLPPNTRDAKTL